MFKDHPDGMRMEPTPERVLAVCQTLAWQEMTQAELIDAMSLGRKDDTARSTISATLSVAEELGAVRPKEGLLTLHIPKEEVSSPAAFRRYASRIAFSNPKSTFFLFSRWYISLNEQAFTTTDGWEDRANRAVKDEPALSGLGENAALGWRFWAAFLGLGYLSGTTLLPNMKTRLQDAFAYDYNQHFSFGASVFVLDFLPWLSNRVPEAGMTLDGSAPLPLAVSAGLRTLRDLDLVRLEAQRDARRIPLFPVDGDPNGDFSHIIVREEVCL